MLIKIIKYYIKEKILKYLLFSFSLSFLCFLHVVHISHAYMYFLLSENN